MSEKHSMIFTPQNAGRIAVEGMLTANEKHLFVTVSTGAGVAARFAIETKTGRVAHYLEPTTNENGDLIFGRSKFEPNETSAL